MLTSGRHSGGSNISSLRDSQGFGVVLSYKHNAPLELKTGPSVTFQKDFSKVILPTSALCIMHNVLFKAQDKIGHFLAFDPTLFLVKPTLIGFPVFQIQ